MAKRENRIYRSKNPIKIIVSVLLSVLIFLFVLGIIVFFSFKKYIVYTAEGVRLEIPWLEESGAEGEA